MTSNAGKKVKSCETTNNRPERPARRQAAAANTVQEVLIPHGSVVSVNMPKRNGQGEEYSKIVHNELLAYVRFYRDCSNVDLLHRVVTGFYSAEDISDAKRILFHEFQSQLINYSFATERRSSSGRAAHGVEVEDIVCIFDVVDVRLTLFVASNFGYMPKYGPEEMNVGAVVDRQVQLESAVDNLRVSVDLNSCVVFASYSAFPRLRVNHI